jgi:hypothetical protein
MDAPYNLPVKNSRMNKEIIMEAKDIILVAEKQNL